MRGVEIPEDIQGHSLRPVWDEAGRTPADWRKAAYYHYYEYPAEHSVKRHYGIRTADMKLSSFLQRHRRVGNVRPQSRPARDEQRIRQTGVCR